jgi:hypothetical protein
MRRVVWVATVALAIVGFGDVGYGQTLIATFDEVAGKWTGHADNHDVTLEIDASGRFTARYVLGGESGTARLESGSLVIPLPDHKGTLQLVKDGDTLKGPGRIDGKIWMVSLVRAAPAAQPD